MEAPLTADDLCAITQLAAAYAHFVDAADTDGLARIFTPDAVFAVYGSEHTPLHDVMAFLTSSTRGTHIVGTPFVQATDAGACGRSRFLFVNATTGAVIAGGYEDTYVQLDGGWRIARRTVSVPSPALA